MATAKVGTIPTCSVCRESFTRPTVLPCGHTFCMTCIEQCIVGRRETFPCPYCKQKVNIPEGGANNFPKNLTVEEIMVFLNNEGQTSTSFQPNQSRDESHPKCSKHRADEMNHYCSNCNIGLCSTCIFTGQHKEHETLDIESDETRNKAIEKLQSLKNFIQKKIKTLEKNRSSFLESFTELKSLCEDSCSKVDEEERKIVLDLGKRCEQIKKDIRENLEENRKKVDDREMEITSEINELESEIDSNIPPSTKTTLNILQTLYRLMEIEEMSDRRMDYNLYLHQLQWVRKDFTLDTDQLGSVTSKLFHIPGLYQFLIHVSDIGENDSIFDEKNTFQNHDIKLMYNVTKHNGKLSIGIRLSSKNHELNYCIIDGKVRLLNFNDDRKTINRNMHENRFEVGDDRTWRFISWSKFIDKNNGYLNVNDQFVIQWDLKQIRDISWK